jgi:hypothetical protein
MLAVASRFTGLLQLCGKPTHLGTEATHLLRRPGEILRANLDLRTTGERPGSDPMATGLPSAEHHPSGRSGKSRTTGHERNLRFAHRAANRVTGILCGLLDCVPGGVNPPSPVRRHFAAITGTRGTRIRVAWFRHTRFARFAVRATGTRCGLRARFRFLSHLFSS